ncbi:hypothetical protein PG990_004762 [Apiospora arundinis]
MAADAKVIDSVEKQDDTSTPDIPIPSIADVSGSSSGQHKTADIVGAASPAAMNYSSEASLELRKRKSSYDQHDTPTAEQMTKRTLWPALCCTLQHVLEVISRCCLQRSGNIYSHSSPPKELGSLLLTNRVFYSYLNPSFPVNEHTARPSVTFEGHLSMLKPDAIWQTARRRFWPRMPAPLRNHTELQMWRLACSRKCQFCGKRGPPSPAISNHRTRSGPGEHGVSIIWPFSVNSCGTCLLERSLKEIDLLLSSIPSLIIPALPSVLLTEDKAILSPGALQNGQGHNDVKLTKLFYTRHVEELKEEFATVKAMGLATAEEWLKGLEDRGKELRGDSSRWEKWEFAGGVSQMRKTQVEYPYSTNHGGAPLETPTKVSLDGKARSSGGESIPVFTTAPADTHVKLATLQVAHDQEPFTRPVPNRTRTQEEIQEMKAARRLEIERRAALLDPPLLPSVLAHIPSFQAALQIIQPLDNNAWDLLKPRLLAQRGDAEVRDSQDQKLIAHSRDARVKVEDRCNANGSHRESKELVDKDWDDAQAPLRAKISEYADETIKDAWHDGHKVNRDTCPKFAVDVLLYVRKRFCAEVVKDAAAARAAGREPILDPPEGPFTQKLTLENMKWLFEVKIKPLTESYRKELFLCNGCDGNSKAYGFEGVIQHYAAKHTRSLSLGNIVVYWRSEWPETPPFHPDPLSKSTQSTLGTPASYPGIYQQQFLPQPPVHNFPQSHPFPLQGASPYRPDYGNQQHSHYPQYPPPQPSFANPPSYDLSYHTPFERPVAPQPMPVPMPLPYQQQQYFSTPYEHNIAAHQRNHIDYGLYSEEKIRVQLDDLAFNSRDVWMALTSLKDLPGNIRVAITIFHLTKRYRLRFSESPPLAMFIDGLSNKKDMRPVRNVNGLNCKACHLHLGHAVEKELRTFSLPQLANHFQQSHIGPFQSAGRPFLDWTVDMIHVPDLSGLQNISGMDAQKEALITETFPEIIASASYHQARDMREIGPAAHHEGYGNAATTPSMTVDAGYPNTSGRYEPGPFLENIYIPSQAEYNQDHQAVVSQLHQSAVLSNPLSEYGIRPSVTPKLELQGRGRDRKSNSKEKRKGSGHNDFRRKGNAKSNEVMVKLESSSLDEKDGEAEAEESRQEEAIRAMWAAERRETARLATTAEAHMGRKRSSPMSGETSPSTKRALAMSSSPRSRQARTYKRPWPASRPVETEPGDDLFAGLESHLDQQACLDSNVTGRESMYNRHSVCEPQHLHVGQPVDLVRPASPAVHSKSVSYERTSPPKAARDVDHTEPIRYREQSARSHQRHMLYTSPAPAQNQKERRVAGPAETVHDTATELMYHDGPSRGYLAGERGENILRNPGARLAEEPGMRREQARARYIETYELVRMRDAEGEYFIRRPVRREMDAAYADLRRLEYLEKGSPGTASGHENTIFSSAHESPTGSERVLRRPLRDEYHKLGSIPYEDHDPRFGLAPANLEAPDRYR